MDEETVSQKKKSVKKKWKDLLKCQISMLRFDWTTKNMDAVLNSNKRNFSWSHRNEELWEYLSALDHS